MKTVNSRIAAAIMVVAASAALVLPSIPASAQQPESRLNRILKNGVLRVCQITNYYAVSLRNPKTDQVEGIDVDLAKELAKELGVKYQLVESSFAAFIADLQADKCDIGMFGIAATLARGKVVEFSKPYLQNSIHAMVRKDGKIKTWEDIDKPGVRVGAALGSYVETFLRGYLKHATLTPVAPPAALAGELAANRGDVMFGDYATALRAKNEFDWAEVIAPSQRLKVTPYAYVVQQGDQVWLNYVNLFVDTIKIDGRLHEFAEKHKLGPIVAP